MKKTRKRKEICSLKYRNYLILSTELLKENNNFGIYFKVCSNGKCFVLQDGFGVIQIL
jgi:hypothetical protein